MFGGTFSKLPIHLWGKVHEPGAYNVYLVFESNLLLLSSSIASYIGFMIILSTSLLSKNGKEFHKCTRLARVMLYPPYLAGTSNQH